MIPSINLERSDVSLNCFIFDTNRSLNLNIHVEEKIMAGSTTNWKVDVIFRLIQKDKTQNKLYEYPLVLNIRQGQACEFQSADPEEFIPSDPLRPFFSVYNLDPIIPFSLMDYLDREPLVVFHAYPEQIMISSKCFKEEKLTY